MSNIWISGLVLLVLGWPAEGLARRLVETGVATADQPEVSSKAPRSRQRRRRGRYRRRRPNLVQLQEVPGVHLLNRKRAWGTKVTVKRLTELASAYHESYPDAPPIWVHDISQRRGGRMPPHLSHRDGQDVDIRLILRSYSEKYRRASPRTLDLEQTWFMLKTLIDSGDVEVIFLDRRLQRALYQHVLKQGFTKDELRLFFEYPRNRGAVIRHWKGHADHIHVRFRRAPRPVPMV